MKLLLVSYSLHVGLHQKQQSSGNQYSAKAWPDLYKARLGLLLLQLD